MSTWTEAMVLEALRGRDEFRRGWFLSPLTFGGRRADAVFLEVWGQAEEPRLTLYEVKVDRADALKEFRDPWKAHAIGRFCRERFLVVPAADLVKPEEVPEEWGVQVVTRASTRTVKPSPVQVPEPVDWPFMFAILKTVDKRREYGEDALEAARKRAFDEGLKEGRRRVERPTMATAMRKWDEEEREAWQAFTDAADVNPRKVEDAAALGNLYTLTMKGGVEDLLARARDFGRGLRHLAENMEAHLKEAERRYGGHDERGGVPEAPIDGEATGADEGPEGPGHDGAHGGVSLPGVPGAEVAGERPHPAPGRNGELRIYGRT